MSDKTRTSLLSLAIIIVLVFSAVSPTIVRADGGDPAEEASAEVTSNPEEDSSETGSEDAAASEEASDSQPAEGAKSDPDATLLSDVPEDTAVTVLDANGEAQPLATQEAADAIATSDPIWCPANQDPTPGANGCTESFSSFTELLTFLSGNSAYQGAGTIYVQQGAYQGSDPDNVIDFNSPSYDLSNINNSDLTVTGGWNTSNNTIDPTSPTVFSEYSILIGSSGNPWGGSLTLNNISIVYDGVPDWGSDKSGIVLYTEEDITLSNVSVTAAPNKGAELHADGDVNIQNSNFQQNVRGGAIIRAGGHVAVANSSFSNPFPDVDRWQNGGLDIVSGESTSLLGVLANMNREFGANIISGGDVAISSSFFSGTKVMWDENGETVFYGYGLNIVTPGDVAIDDVTANDNFLWGAMIDAEGDIAIANSVFNENTTEDPGFIDDTGLFITGGGEVALNNVTASDNRLYGAQIQAVGTVAINNSAFDNNRGVVTIDGLTSYNGHGLQIESLADIFINNTSAVNNMLFGAQLNAAGQVAVANSSFSDTSTGSDENALGKGLEIVSGGNASLASVALNNNQTVGADIQAGGDVFLDLVAATNNGTDGVAVDTACTHVFGGIYAGNGQYGLNLGTSALDVISPPIFAGNGAGNIFPEDPVSCAPAVISGGGSPNLFAGSFASLSTSTGSTSGNMSLTSFLAYSKTASSYGIFIGKYNYVHTDDGLQIIALDPSDNQIAMNSS